VLPLNISAHVFKTPVSTRRSRNNSGTVFCFLKNRGRTRFTLSIVISVTFVYEFLPCTIANFTIRLSLSLSLSVFDHHSVGVISGSDYEAPESISSRTRSSRKNIDVANLRKSTPTSLSLSLHLSKSSSEKSASESSQDPSQKASENISDRGNLPTPVHPMSTPPSISKSLPIVHSNETSSRATSTSGRAIFAKKGVRASSRL